LDQYGAGRRAVALPQLLPVRAVVGREEQRPVYVGQVARVSASGRWDEVRDGNGAGGDAAALPQVLPGRAIAGLEEQRPIHVREVAGVRTVGIMAPVISGTAAREDVSDEGRAGGGAVALPQLLPVRAVVGREEQRPVNVGQVAYVNATE